MLRFLLAIIIGALISSIAAPQNTRLPLIIGKPQATSTPTNTSTSISTVTSTSTPTFTPTIVPTETPPPTVTATRVTSGPCPCDGDTLNCTNFGTHSQAQACFDFCVSQGRGDIHKLDQDNDGDACESLPGGFVIVR